MKFYKRRNAANDPRFTAPPDGVGGDPRIVAVLPRVIRWTLVAVVAVALLTAWLIAGAETLTGLVVGISDGDTITVLVGRDQVKIRLADIDAPESKQAFGTRSKQVLSDLCFQKDARLETQGKDRYGRTIATVYCAGRDANAEQVWQGMAWVFDRYAKPGSPLYVFQEQAKAARRGLWSDATPTPPWEWRRREWAGKEIVQPAVSSGPARQAMPQKWVCDRKEIPEQNRVEIDCGWR